MRECDLELAFNRKARGGYATDVAGVWLASVSPANTQITIKTPPGTPLSAIEIPILRSIQVIALQFVRIPIAQFTIASVAVAAGGPEKRASAGSELTVEASGRSSTEVGLPLVVVVALAVVVEARVLDVQVVAVLVAQFTVLLHGWRKTDATSKAKRLNLSF